MTVKEIKIYKKALTLAREYMFNVMCAEDVPSEEWFIKCAKEENNRILETIKVKDKEIEKQSEIIQETTRTTYHKLMEKDIIFHLNKHKEELEEQVAKQEKELEYIQKQLAEKEQENSHLKRVINIITSSKYGSLSKDSCKKLTDEEFKNIMQNDVYYKQIKEELSEEIKELKTKLNSIYGINGAKQLAIDELEEVKEKLNKYNKEHCFKPIENYICERAIKFVDEQIKELKRR